jgi:RNA polymerase sigma factor (sigma-70 family)
MGIIRGKEVIMTVDTPRGTVLLVDDDESVRRSLKRLLQAAGLEVQTFSGASRVSRCERPAERCCMVLDVKLPGQTGLELKQSLDAAGVRIPTIFLTGIGDVAMGVSAMKAGAFDFLTKPFDADALLKSIDSALGADARALANERRRDVLRTLFETLTGREREVFFGVTSGRANKQIARELGISEKTVKVHRARAVEKLAADSIAQLVRMADQLQSLGYAGPVFETDHGLRADALAVA